MFINRKNLLTLSLTAILGLSSHAFAARGNGNSSPSGVSSYTAMGDMNRTRSENTLRYKKQQGEKLKYQHQYRHTHQNAYQNSRINSALGNPVNRRSSQDMKNE